MTSLTALACHSRGTKGGATVDWQLFSLCVFHTSHGCTRIQTLDYTTHIRTPFIWRRARGQPPQGTASQPGQFTVSPHKSMTHRCFRATSTATSTHQSPPQLGRSRPGPYGTIERQTNMDNTYAQNNIHHLVPSGFFFFFFSAGHFTSEKFLGSNLFMRREQKYRLGQEFQRKCMPHHSCR